MRTMIKMLTLAAWCCSLTMNAANVNDVKMEITGSSSFKLVLGQVSQATKVQLKDELGYVLYEEDVTEDRRYARQFELQALPNGKYYLELEDGTTIKVYALRIKHGHLYNEKSASRKYFKPVLRQSDSQLAISHLSPQHSPLKVVIYDPQNQVLLRDKLQGNMNLGRLYDVSGLAPGIYKITLASEGRTYNHQLRLQQ